MKKFIKKIFFETSALSWTIGGTGIVLITLSGETREIILFDSNSKEKKRIKITDKQSIKLQKETTDKISGLVQCIGLVK